jgi:lipopolysaccharide/colanic/teichoic acid biosynthesis glycosyltransferase
MSSPDRILAASRPIPPALIMAADLAVASLAPILAHWARQQEHFDLDAIMSYWAASMLCSGACFLLFGIERSIWRYFSWRELVPLATAVVTAVSSASFLAFSLDRMQAVSRSEPLLHGAILLSCLIVIRIVARQVERSKRSRSARSRSSNNPVRQALVIGTSPLAEVYLRMVDEMASFTRRPVDVVGIVAEKPRHVGRLLRGRPITGTLADIGNLTAKLSVHGVRVDLVVLAVQDKYHLSAASGFLRELEAEGAEIIALQTLFGGQPGFEAAPEDPLRTSTPPPELGTWRGKRLVDIVLSAMLLILFSPLFLFVCACVLADIGSPVIFWQIRPGFRGVATRFYKIRTMKHVQYGVVRPDQERISHLGRFLRRTRLDETPQLFNIIVGQMSFVGPRPLLPRDLHEDGSDRIQMRPGVTGWAQVNGGKLINPKDKMALDIWYAYHASFRLDLVILWRTVLTILRGDRVQHDAIEQARSFLKLRQRDLSPGGLSGYSGNPVNAEVGGY